MACSCTRVEKKKVVVYYLEKTTNAISGSGSKFIDANVFVHAYLKPKRILNSAEIRIKQSAKSIVSRVNGGEVVFLSVIHFSELCNILEDHMPLRDAADIERAICQSEFVEMLAVAKEEYLSALETAGSRTIGINDALTYELMKRNNVQELYSFDQDFDRFTDLKRLSK